MPRLAMFERCSGVIAACFASAALRRASDISSGVLLAHCLIARRRASAERSSGVMLAQRLRPPAAEPSGVAHPRPIVSARPWQRRQSHTTSSANSSAYPRWWCPARRYGNDCPQSSHVSAGISSPVRIAAYIMRYARFFCSGVYWVSTCPLYPVRSAPPDLWKPDVRSGPVYPNKRLRTVCPKRTIRSLPTGKESAWLTYQTRLHHSRCAWSWTRKRTWSGSSRRGAASY